MITIALFILASVGLLAAVCAAGPAEDWWRDRRRVVLTPLESALVEANRPVLWLAVWSPCGVVRRA